jgi:uncharacterized protein YbjQ (UPF0145 family)
VDDDVRRLLAALEAGDEKDAYEAFESYYRHAVLTAEASDQDLVRLLPVLDDMVGHGAYRAKLAHVGDFRRLVHRDPDSYPLSAELMRDQVDAARLDRVRTVESARESRVAAAREAASRFMPMSTTPDLPGRQIDYALALVSGACVMSRGAFSDLGSDLKSVGGGTLGGIEKAVEAARATAQSRLEEAARRIGADAVVGIDLTVQTVADKAQLVMLMGTAVQLRD